MSEQMNKLTPLHAHVRGRGKRMTVKERKEAQEAFLARYANNGNVRLSCLAANVSRSTFYIWLETDQEFSMRWHQAEKDFADLALAEFRKRAMEGYEKPLVSMGRLVYEEIPVLDKDGKQAFDSKGRPVTRRGKQQMERVVSDNLLAMLIKKHFPEYREKSSVEVNQTTTQNVNVKHQIVVDTRRLSGMTDDELAQFKRFAEKLKAEESQG